MKIGEAGETMEKVGDKIAGVGTNLTKYVTAPILGLGTAAVKTTADFDASMSKVSAVSGATGEDLEELRAKAREMGSQTKFSASEAADAMNYMAMAGWKTTDMLDGVEGIMNLAAASGEDLATTSDIVTDALTALGMSAEDSAHFADILAAASSNANTNVSLMGESFKFVAPVAGAMGASAEDLSIALGFMANSGIKGSQAGNSLKNALVNLVKPTDKQAAAMEALGLITTETVNVIDQAEVDKAMAKVESKTIDVQKAQIAYNDAVAKYGAESSQAQTKMLSLQKVENALTAAQEELTKAQQGTIETVSTGQSALVDEYGNMKSLGEIMNILRQNLGAVNVDLVDSKGNLREYDDIIAELESTEEGLTQAEQLKNAAIIFGKQNLSGMMAIINATEEDYNKLTDAIYGCEGTAQNMAETMQDNLNGQLTILKSQLQELAISFGDLLMPTIRAIVSKIQAFVDKLNALSPATKETILKIALVAAALGPLLVGIGKTISIVGKLMQLISKMPQIIASCKAVFAKLGAAISGISAPVVAVVAVIAVLIAAFKHLWDTNEDFRNKITAIWEQIKGAFEKLTSGIVDRLNGLGFDFKNIGEVIHAVWEGLCSYLAPVFETTFKIIADVLSAAVDIILGIVDVFIGIFTGDWDKAWTGIKEIFSGIWDAIVSALGGVMELLCNIFGTNLEEVTAFWSDVWTNIKTFFVNIWNSITGFVSGVLNGIKTFFTNIWTAIKDFFVGIWTAIYNSVSEKIELIRFVITTVWNAIYTTISTVLNAIWSVITTVWQTIYDIISPLLDAFKYLFETIFKAIQILIGRAMDWVHEKITAIWNAIVAFLTPILEGIRDFFQTIWNAISTTVSTVLDAIYNVIMTVWNAVSGFISSVLNAIWSVVSSIWNSISAHISAVLNAIYSVVSSIWNAVSGFISGILNTIFATVANIWNNIKTTITNVMNAVKTTVSSIWDSVKNAVTQKITAIKDTIVNGFNAAVSFIKGLASQAFQWGADIIDGIVGGIKNCIGKVSDAVRGVAGKIRSFLHFSVPDEGPLADFESWMPDFMQGLSDGINANASVVTDTLTNFANGVTETVKNIITKALDGIVNITSGFMDQVFAVIKTIWDNAKNTIDSVLSQISKGVTGGWKGIVNTIRSALNDIKTVVTTTWKAVGTVISTALDGIQKVVTAVWAAMKTLINTGQLDIKNVISTTWSAAKDVVNDVLSAIRTVVQSVWNAMPDIVRNPMNQVKDAVLSIWDNIRDGIGDRLGGVRDAVNNVMGAVYDAVMDKVNNSWSWGRDLIQNLVNGIRYLYADVVNAVADVANAIWEYLHFSVPEKGPLTTVNEWMPDFMKGLADGIDRSRKYVEKAVESVSGAMQLSMQSGLEMKLDGISGAMLDGGAGGTVINNYNNDNSRTVNQTNNSPKSLSRLEIYRQTRNALNV